MKTLNFDLFGENVLTSTEMFNVRGGDGDEGTTNNTSSTTEAESEDVIL